LNSAGKSSEYAVGGGVFPHPELFIRTIRRSGILPLLPNMRQDAASTRFMNNTSYFGVSGADRKTSGAAERLPPRVGISGE
jgi:hypothetical protein